METPLKNAEEGLNHLIIIANDGKEGYTQAADIVSQPMLKAIFAKYATERAGFAAELSALVVAAGAEPQTGTGPLGALHRVWVDIKSSLAANDDEAALKECIRGDETAVSAYETALKEYAFTQGQQSILTRQSNLTGDALLSLKQELQAFKSS